MDEGGNGRGALTAAGLSCAACGAQLGATAKFCSECGTPVAQVTQSAEYKQVTVLFADVVRSMATEDHRNAIAAFAEKRPPSYENR